MSDRYDPKTSARPQGDRRPGAATDDDPLAELARIVTGRSSFGSQGRDQAGEGPEGSGDAGDGAADLESELLNDLQASFAALGGPFQDGSAPAGQPEAQAPRRTPEPRQTPEPEPARPPADDLTLDFEKSVEEVLAELEGATRVQPPPSVSMSQ